MPLTPADIHNTTFGKSALTRRGYDTEQVDALLDDVTQEMIQLLEENDDLRRRADLAQAAGVGAAPGRPDRAELTAVTGELERARRARDLAEQNARILQSRLADARRAATVEAAGDRSDHPDGVLTMAHRAADDYLQRAHQESGQLLADARSRSERIAEDAWTAAHGIETDSQQRNSRAASELRDRHTAVLDEIDALSGLAETYRALLKDQVRRQAQL
ncbi:DivIVA domain-containing protein [Paractinoplanes rishiriensis]|uniref:Cell wall synthesis protein Wag31 n=1 Tax=Paractinoplanes rishiriensis TaxID=1050105 RepID=A0A919JTE7_9ACTN|nr:DivIVA domain-containing protein [Actinoplanes rishiriensis]GIE93032.1 cell wall synthesis protein Wag31 [Actinoplanes rishiriensis]